MLTCGRQCLWSSMFVGVNVIQIFNAFPQFGDFRNILIILHFFIDFILKLNTMFVQAKALYPHTFLLYTLYPH
jgi:hypothetical protein